MAEAGASAQLAKVAEAGASAGGVMQAAGIRADPETRLPRRVRRGSGILGDTRLAWALTFQSMRRFPVRTVGALLVWAAARYLCLHGLAIFMRARLDGTAPPHAGALTIAGVAAMAVIADAGPVFLATFIMPPVHRLIMGAGPPAGDLATLGRHARLFGAVFAMALAALLIVDLARILPLFLLPRLGQISTLLTLILLFPPALLALAGLLRLSFGLPALSLGHRLPFAEGWAISRGQVFRSACVSAAAGLPLLLFAAIWIWLRPGPLGWAATIAAPCWDLIFVSLTASLTGVFYRANRLPPAFRPDVRPSRNRNQRREPNFQ